MALDVTLISIKIVDKQPEKELQAADEHEGKAAPVKRVLDAHQGAQASLPEPQCRRRDQQYEPQTPLSTLFRSLVALVPNTIFAYVSGVLGLVGAVAITLLAVLVLMAACVVQSFHEMVPMLVKTDRALLRFSTGGGALPPVRQQPEKSPLRSPGHELVQAALSLLNLSCDLLVIGFFKGTVALSYCCALYGTIAIPTLIWTTAVNSSTGSAPELFFHLSFAEAPVTFALLHGGMWLFALLWLGVTATMSQSFSQNLSSQR